MAILVAFNSQLDPCFYSKQVALSIGRVGGFVGLLNYLGNVSKACLWGILCLANLVGVVIGR